MIGRMRTRLAILVALAAGVVGSVAARPAPALAQPADKADNKADMKEAAKHYKEAEAAMARGDYELAATSYAVAYEITRDAVLFYKIAIAKHKAGKCDAAVTYYRRYLKEGNPDAEFKRLTEERIVECT